MVVSKNIKIRTNMWHSNTTSGYISKRIEIRIWKKYLYSHVHCSIIQNSQDIGTTHMSNDRWRDKDNVVGKYNGKLTELEEICSTKQLSHRRTDNAQFHQYEVSKTATHTEVENRMVVARWWRGGEGSRSYFIKLSPYKMSKFSRDLLYNIMPIVTDIVLCM